MHQHQSPQIRTMRSGGVSVLFPPPQYHYRLASPKFDLFLRDHITEVHATNFSSAIEKELQRSFIHVHTEGESSLSCLQWQ